MAKRLNLVDGCRNCSLARRQDDCDEGEFHAHHHPSDPSPLGGMNCDGSVGKGTLDD
jgi:hypothetical protein